MVNAKGSSVRPASSWTLTANGGSAGILTGPGVDNQTNDVVSGASFKAGSYALSESGDQTGYTASNWVCTGTGTQSGNSITLSVGQSATCTITNTDIEPTIQITKTADPSAVPATGGNVTFTFTVWNTSAESVTLSSLTDTVFGDLNSKGTCSVPQTLAKSDGSVGGADTYTCTYTLFLKGTLNSNGMGYINHYNVATTTATDGNDTTTASDDATVTFTWRGRTPGYWKNHPTEWPKFSVVNYKGATIPITTKTLVRDVFNVPTSKDFSCIGTKDTLLTALSYKGGSTLCGATQTLLRAATAALLNEAYFGSAYPAYDSTTKLIEAVNAAIASGNRQTIINLAATLDYWNNGIH